MEGLSWKHCTAYKLLGRSGGVVVKDSSGEHRVLGLNPGSDALFYYKLECCKNS